MNAKVKIEQEFNPTVNDLLEMADDIWRFVQRPEHNNIEWKDLYNQVYNKYRDFAMTYPGVINMMCVKRQYRRKVFAAYLKKLNMWNSELSFFKSQVEYIVMLHKKVNKGWSKQQLDVLRNNMLMAMEDEAKKTREIGNRAKADVEKVELARVGQIGRHLYAFCEKEDAVKYGFVVESKEKSAFEHSMKAVNAEDNVLHTLKYDEKRALYDD